VLAIYRAEVALAGAEHHRHDIVLERYQGRLPLWLAPVQACVMPVGLVQDSAARALVDTLIVAGLRRRLEVDGSLGLVRSSDFVGRYRSRAYWQGRGGAPATATNRSRLPKSVTRSRCAGGDAGPD